MITGVTIGDPNGVGPEILLRAYHLNKLPGGIIAIGDYEVLEFAKSRLKLDILLNKIPDSSLIETDALNVIDLGLLKADEIDIGRISEKAGKTSLAYIDKGTKLALGEKIDALVTLPVNKEAIRITQSDFTGHTGYIASLCRVSAYTMMLVTGPLIVTHVSTHVSLREAIQLVTRDRILEVIRLTDKAVRQLKGTARIAVAGLNPHAGESNAFGSEDSREIIPAVLEAQKSGINVQAPIPADTVFYRAVKGDFDAVVSMYHDQGHIAVKIVGFESAVNVTLGLPIIRTSVDHGTAYDIAYIGIASVSSFVNACGLAEKLVSKK